MNPRHRRLLIPGLLIALMVIVLVSSLARRADGAAPSSKVVSTISDPRIAESSGLALSRAHDDLGYTINDSGNGPYVYAIKISTGEVVGVTRIDGGDLLDTEAIALDRDGTLWIADTGDNRFARGDSALYALPEPGAGDHTVTARRYSITYADGPQNVEALLIDPATDAKLLVSKGLLAGDVYPVPADLDIDGTNTLKALDVDVPGVITDGTFAEDGSYAVLRDYSKAHIVDARTWETSSTIDLPGQRQGESIAMEAGDTSFLIGSEGASSTLIRVFMQDAPRPSATPTPVRTSSPPASPPGSASDSGGFEAPTWVLAAGAVVLLGLAGAWVVRRSVD